MTTINVFKACHIQEIKSQHLQGIERLQELRAAMTKVLMENPVFKNLGSLLINNQQPQGRFLNARLPLDKKGI